MTPRSSSSSSRASSLSSRSRRAAAALAVSLLAVALVAIACDDGSSPSPNATVTADPTLRATAIDNALIDVRIGDVLVRAEPAVSAQERSQGLSDREAMPLDVGMLFVFEAERIPSFTMRRMHFPLDFIWISGDRRVVDLTEDVPNPNAPGEELSGIQPSVEVLYVIEVNAGFIADNGIAIGDEVTFERDPGAE